MNVTAYAPSVRRSVPIVTPLLSTLKKVIQFIFSNPRRIFYLVLAALAAFGLYTIFLGGRNESTPKILPLNQKFDVVAKTKDGKNTNGKINVDVNGTYNSGSILVQGQRVLARNGKQFLVVNMELSNSYNVPLYVFPVDSFRLVGADGKKYAPTAHQGNVEIRPQSTKTSNVGFVVEGDQKTFKVEVGELNSEKTLLEFTLK